MEDRLIVAVSLVSKMISRFWEGIRGKETIRVLMIRVRYVPEHDPNLSGHGTKENEKRKRRKKGLQNLIAESTALGWETPIDLDNLVGQCVAVDFNNITHHEDEVHVGVVLDMGSKEGKIVHSCISMEVSDFYQLHNSYTTRLLLHARDSKGEPLHALSAAFDILDNIKVEAIIGAKIRREAKFLAELGDKAEVPVISLSEPSSYLQSNKYPFFIQSTQDVENDNIVEELYKLKDFQTKVFIVHMSEAPVSKLLINAKRLGTISEGYACFVTASTMNLLGFVDSFVIGSMQGLVGFKSYIPPTKDHQNLALRLRRKFSIELSVYGIWAYDSIWALAEAVERARDYNKLVSGIKNGSLLVEEILRSRFLGLSVFSGFCIEAFMLAIRKLPYPIEVEFIPYGGTYNDLVYQVYLGPRVPRLIIPTNWDSVMVHLFGEKLLNSLSKFVVIMWVFVVLILTNSYTATLTSMMTVQQIQFNPNGNYLGYQLDSPVQASIFSLNFEGFKPYSSLEEYAEALSKGSKHGGVSAIVDEVPYIKKFVAKYPGDYTVKTMPMSNTNGFGYEAGELAVLETCSRAYSEEALLSPSDDSANDPHVLRLDFFRGLFLISGISSVLAFLLFFSFAIEEKMEFLKYRNIVQLMALEKCEEIPLQ
ncbi:glutamate receptor 1.2-like [Ziziphus jujuba]|uniref:Glutamate receptor 1.2-like n=1 Tax=Ziziphus jujuba TaxID=326968 RepID=A0ABM4A3R4_ZIZJJ|nr:glutamate receptor 1.2-like [Ziziphus jujuba]